MHTAIAIGSGKQLSPDSFSRITFRLKDFIEGRHQRILTAVDYFKRFLFGFRIIFFLIHREAGRSQIDTCHNRFYDPFIYTSHILRFFRKFLFRIQNIVKNKLIDISLRRTVYCHVGITGHDFIPQRDISKELDQCKIRPGTQTFRLTDNTILGFGSKILIFYRLQYHIRILYRTVWAGPGISKSIKTISRIICPDIPDLFSRFRLIIIVGKNFRQIQILSLRI